ncbi:class IV lanthionine synthetase LanL [Streptomyces morookaense]|uniref:non-specific serine/threonine protein kinase n=1 Tax=Streptomyces morookaense TaxID=1970 RepID=A0A7Y7E619_STRMO|nr:class IV lanthionine synthetase LanL [Streptomyces morookaense]NVK77415.1 protein kinase/lanthionine synthetase C family protein [Streptomyces morookaense]GHF21594.1 serine/threonine protein kinase [Streptomyces morookaense]
MTCDDREFPGDAPLLRGCVRAALARHGATEWHIVQGDFWCHVAPCGKRPGVQGWKLHLSATPLSAPLVLARAADVLVGHRCAFKFAGSLARVTELLSRGYGRGSGGKFITAYPDGDENRLRELAAELHRATLGLPGPGILSDRPYRAGSLVHYRFGVHDGVPVLGDDGSYEAMLMAPDGTLARDERHAWFSPPRWAPHDPFASPSVAHGGTAAGAVRLDGRYTVRQVVRHAFTGGVYRATDDETGLPVVIKQARPHTGATLTGQDVRDARRNEAAMLELLEPTGITPRPLGLFEQQHDLFLVQEELPGVTLRRWVADNIAHDGGTWGPPDDAVERIAWQLLELVELVHGHGLVLRDFNPGNVMVLPDEELRLIDLEHLARPGDPVTRVYTPGYAAPEQIASPYIGTAPGPTADCYSLGATLFHAATGVDPQLPPDRPMVRPGHRRIQDWLGTLCAGNPAARRLAPAIVALMHDDPARRPGPGAVRGLLGGGTPLRRPGRLGDAELKQLIGDALDHLLTTMDPAAPQHLWPPSPFGATTDPCNVQHGAAGILGVLVRAYESAPDPALREAVAAAAHWTGRTVGREPRVLPGLHFGRSGTAWALLAAGRALGDEELVAQAHELAGRVPLRPPNPDICHGAAGAGMTQLRFWEDTGSDRFLDRAREAADAVAAARERRETLSYWPVPRGSASRLAGLVHYGFAHGVAGAGAFLLAAGRAAHDSGHLAMAAEAGETLLATAQSKDGAAYWPEGPSGRVLKTHWCSGSSGIGTFLIRLWQETRDERLREASHRAAVAVRRSRWHAGTSQCHGLAGDGEFLLDLAEATGQDTYRGWAEELAVGIYARHAVHDGRVLVPDETGAAVSADYNTGLAGVLAFLLRLRDGGPRLWLPTSFTGPPSAR